MKEKFLNFEILIIYIRSFFIYILLKKKKSKTMIIEFVIGNVFFVVFVYLCVC